MDVTTSLPPDDVYDDVINGTVASNLVPIL
jgi:hypothetical protein